MKRNTLALAAALLVLTPVGLAFAGETYNIDTTHSFIGFSVKHMAVSSVRGEFKDYSAKLVVDEQSLENSTIELEIQAASIDTRNEDRDNHLRNEDFFEVATYPTIVFKSKRIEKGSDGRYKAIGDLTIKETTREVALDLEINGPIRDPWGNNRVGAEGELTIDRKDFGVQFSRVMDNGGLVVGNEVDIEFALEAARKAD